MTLRRVINDSQEGVEKVDWPRANGSGYLIDLADKA